MYMYDKDGSTRGEVKSSRSRGEKLNPRTRSHLHGNDISVKNLSGSVDGPRSTRDCVVRVTPQLHISLQD